LESAVASEEAFFFVQSRDSFGNEVTVGGAKVEALLHTTTEDTDNDASGKAATHTITGTVTDNGDGIYRVVYIAKQAIMYILQVLANEQAVLKLGQVHFKLQARDRF